jgi:hypothetical protein
VVKEVKGGTMYNTPASAPDALSQVRGIVVRRLEEVEMILREHADQQGALAQIQMQVARERAQLHSVLKTIDNEDSDAPIYDTRKFIGDGTGPRPIPPAPGLGYGYKGEG